MRPNLSLLSVEGVLLDQKDLPDLLQNSIRHLALTGVNIAFATQWKGDPGEPVPLPGLWTPGQPPQLCDPAPDDAFTKQGCAGSIAANASRILITSPKGGAAMIFGVDGQPIAPPTCAVIFVESRLMRGTLS